MGRYSGFRDFNRLFAGSIAIALSSACSDYQDVVARWSRPPTELPEPEPTGRPDPPLDPGAAGAAGHAGAPSDEGPRLLELTGAIQGVRDVDLIEAKGRIFLFHTGQGVPSTYSDDLLHWEEGSAVFESNPEWISEAVPNATHLWGPTVVHFNGLYHLYYAASTVGSFRSCIGHATTVELGEEALWTDQGRIICSNVDTTGDDWDAIDPHVSVTDSNELWMVFGSHRSGIQLIRLDEEGGRADEERLQLATRPNKAVQAPVLLQHDGYFYLFTSIDPCCARLESTRKVIVGRSSKVTGPYVDKEGIPLLEGGGTVLLEGTERWIGPGASAILRHGGRIYHAFNSYDAEEEGIGTLRISELVWDSDGWPVSAGP